MPAPTLSISATVPKIIQPITQVPPLAESCSQVTLPELLDTVAYVAKELGYTNAMFVHGLDGLDEISLLGATRINELRDGKVKTYEITPEQFGLRRCSLEEIRTGTPEENAATIRGVFEGKITGPRRDAIVFNAAGALIVGGKAADFPEGIALADRLIESGAALEKLAQLKEHSNAFPVTGQ